MPEDHLPSSTPRRLSAGRWATLVVRCVAIAGACALVATLIAWSASYRYYGFVQRTSMIGPLSPRAPGVQDYTGHDTTLVLETGHLTLDRWFFSTIDRYPDLQDFPATDAPGWRAHLSRSANPSFFRWQNRWNGPHDWSVLGVEWSRGPSWTGLGDDWMLAVHFRTLFIALALATAAAALPMRRQWVRARRIRRGECANCGYDRQGSASGSPCPECGSILSANAES